MAAPSITPLPSPPLPTDAEAVFDAKAGAFIEAQTDMVPEINQAIVWMNGVLIDTQSVAANAAAAAQSAARAYTSEQNASVFAAAAQAAAGIPSMAGKAGLSLMVSQNEQSAYWGSPFPSYSGNGGRYLQLNTAGTALQWVRLGFMHVVDEKPSGTPAGDSVSGAYNTRDLNTVRVNTISGASLSSNSISLPAGTYRLRAFSPIGSLPTGNRCRILNITTGLVIAIGDSSVAAGSRLTTEFTIASTTAIRLEQRVVTGRSQGLGYPCSFGDAEVYSEISIEKVA